MPVLKKDCIQKYLLYTWIFRNNNVQYLLLIKFSHFSNLSVWKLVIYNTFVVGKLWYTKCIVSWNKAGSLCNDCQFSACTEYVWTQEEHRNMGAWSFVSSRFENLVGCKVNTFLNDLLMFISIWKQILSLINRLQSSCTWKLLGKFPFFFSFSCCLFI